jgi:hypothetical protein
MTHEPKSSIFAACAAALALALIPGVALGQPQQRPDPAAGTVSVLVYREASRPVWPM